MNRNDAAELSTRLLKELAPQRYAEGWRFGGFDRAVTRLGYTKYKPKVFTLSGPITDNSSAYDVEQTIRHEIAHVLVGPGHHHDYMWKRTARSIGYKGETTSPLSDEARAAYRYHAKCPHGCSFGYYRKPSAGAIVGRCRKHSSRVEWFNADWSPLPWGK